MGAWLLLAIAAAVAAAALAHEWWTKRRARRLTANMPGWTDLPLLGSLHRFYGGPEVIFQRLLEITFRTVETGFFKLWLGPHFFISVFKPEDVKIVTNTYTEKTYLYNFSRPWLGNGLVTAPSHIWKHNIKNLGSTFTGSVVDGYQDTFNHHGRRLLQNMRREVGQPPFDALKKYLAYTTLESICQTALGVAAITESIITEEYYLAFNRTLELMVQRALNPLVHPDLIYRLTPAYYEFQRSIKILHNVSETVLAKRREEWAAEKKKNHNSNHIQNEDKKSKFRSFLDILIELSETDPLMTPEQIRSEVDTIIVGGQETTASTLFYTLLMLGCHQDVQDKLFNELKEIFGDSHRAVEKEDLARMTYCDAVIMETMRLLPSVPAVMRYVDTDLHLDGCTIPAGTCCIVNIWGAGRSPQLWGEDVLLFRPERWLDGKVPPAVHPAAFLPFSYGRRSCIGKKYAMAIIKTLLAHLLRELRVESQAQNLRFKFDVALRPTTGHLMQVRLRG